VKPIAASAIRCVTQLSNLYDFDPAKHTAPDDQLTGLGSLDSRRLLPIGAGNHEAYEKFEFHVVYQKVSQFIAVELSATYHDVVKDRLYTDAANSPRRRSTQTALHRLVLGLCRLLSPVLAFTTDEAWDFIPAKIRRIVHLTDWTGTASSARKRNKKPGNICLSCANSSCRNWKKHARPKPSARPWMPRFP